MKRIAIITPCILPVPASKGGAVEELITRLIDDNELNNRFEIDLFTCEDKDQVKKYSHTQIIPVGEKYISHIVTRITDKYYRTKGTTSSQRPLDKIILETFVQRLSGLDEPYYAVVVQNIMSTAVKIADYCQGKYGFPVYFHMHNDVDIYRSPEYIRHLVKNGVQFIAISEYIKNQLLKYEKTAVVHILYNGVDLTKYKRIPKPNNEKITFLYAGRIIPGKGVKELANAFSCFIGNLSDDEKEKFELNIVGFSGTDISYEQSIKKLAKANKQMHLYDKVPQSEIVSWYAKSDVVAMPTADEEPFGLVALESLAMGKPLITTNSGAIPEVVGDSALIVDKNHAFVDNLTSAIKKLAYDKEMRNQLSLRAYSRARDIKEYDLSSYYNRFYTILAGRKKRGKISVIVPIYNVADYLKECLESLIKQSYSDIEILLINDGSTDNSLEICNKFAEADDRIEIISQANQGLSAARNTGLEAATGDYIFFCDSDDHIQTNALEVMLEKLIDDNSDVVACGFANVWYDTYGTVKREVRFTSSTPGMWGGREAVVQMMRTNNICTVAWNKLYKKHLWDGIRFTKGVLHEDEALTYKLLYKAGIVSYTPELFYKYRQRDGSIMDGDIVNRYGFYVQALEDRIEFFYQLNEKELVDHSVVSLLEQLKYAYRCTADANKKKEISEEYSQYLIKYGVPSVLGTKKKFALQIWKYVKY